MKINTAPTPTLLAMMTLLFSSSALSSDLKSTLEKKNISVAQKARQSGQPIAAKAKNNFNTPSAKGVSNTPSSDEDTSSPVVSAQEEDNSEPVEEREPEPAGSRTSPRSNPKSNPKATIAAIEMKLKDLKAKKAALEKAKSERLPAEKSLERSLQTEKALLDQKTVDFEVQKAALERQKVALERQKADFETKRAAFEKARAEQLALEMGVDKDIQREQEYLKSAKRWAGIK